MQLVYNSDSFVVVQFEADAEAAHGPLKRGGYEIVDKFARKEIYLEGLLADSFEQGVQELVEASPGDGPSVEAFDDLIGRFTALAQHPLVLH